MSEVPLYRWMNPAEDMKLNLKDADEDNEDIHEYQYPPPHPLVSGLRGSEFGS